MSALFNSLGSNYSTDFVKVAEQLLQGNKKIRKNKKELTSALSSYFPAGDFHYFYKGRDAIAAALTLLNKTENKTVFIQAFACYAVEEAVLRAGLEPLYVDIGERSLNLTVETLEKTAHVHGYPLALLVQHTLGYSADIKQIKKWCTEHHVFLIEDLAQAFGAKDTEGTRLGTYGDVVIGSFGRDKIIDAVSGGFLFIPNSSTTTGTVEYASEEVSAWQITKDLLYPVITNYFKKQYPALSSKLVLEFAKKLGLIQTPLAAPSSSRILPDQHATLALECLKQLDEQLVHRRIVATKYYEKLRDTIAIEIPVTQAHIQQGSCLRFPVLVSNPERIISEAKKKQIFISDRWYRAPVDCSTLECSSIYKINSCTNAENASRQIINLPTHQHVNDKHLETLVEILQQHA